MKSACLWYSFQERHRSRKVECLPIENHQHSSGWVSISSNFYKYRVVFGLNITNPEGILPSHRSIPLMILLRLREAKENADPELVITLIGNKADKARSGLPTGHCCLLEGSPTAFFHIPISIVFRRFPDCLWLLQIPLFVSQLPASSLIVLRNMDMDESFEQFIVQKTLK